jgi:hypothetical protein|tara:strand:- start:119 stop:439 length:321 start_codon:yes stop_codon:yes gene_type:complete
MSKDVILSLDQIRYAMGDKAEEFVEVMLIVDDIIENPGRYIGMQAAKYAAVLAAYRTKVIVKAQAYKRNSTIMSNEDKITKDIWYTLHEALEENINTLKLLARSAT